MTSEERALRLVRERRFHKLDMDAVRALAKHADAANLSVDELNGAAWLSRVIDAAVAEALAARWVPVTERMPHVDEYVLVTYRHGLSGVLSVCEAAFRGKWDADDPPSWDSHGWPIQDVTAWQPLPAPWVAP